MIVRHRPFWPCSLTLLIACLAGCVSGQSELQRELLTSDQDAGTVELSATPFFPQDDYQCGPAALATALGASGISVTPTELTPKVYLPKRQGSLQLELVAAARRYHRIPYQIEPSLAHLLKELQTGHPVIVLQNLGVFWFPVWHYAVVIGYAVESDQITLRSGTSERRQMPTSLFLRTWGRADNWGLVVLKPGELPANPQSDRYLEAVSALESSGAFGEALTAYQAALARWPSSFWARLGVANSYIGLGRTIEAEHHLRQLLLDQPAHPVVLNNLAEVLAGRGCLDEALETINQGLAAPQLSAPIKAALTETYAKITRLHGVCSQSGSCTCQRQLSAPTEVDTGIETEGSN